jgi:hypothetical protein
MTLEEMHAQALQKLRERAAKRTKIQGEKKGRPKAKAR